MLQVPVVPDIRLGSDSNGNGTYVHIPSVVHALELYPIGSRRQKTRCESSRQDQLPFLDTKDDGIKSHEASISTKCECRQTEDTDSTNSLVTPSYVSSTAQLQARVKAKLGQHLFGALKQRLQSRQMMFVASVPSREPVRNATGELKSATHSTQNSSLREASRCSRITTSDKIPSIRQREKSRRHPNKASAFPQLGMHNLMSSMPTATQCSWKPEMMIMNMAKDTSSHDHSSLTTNGMRIRKCHENGSSMWEEDQTSKIELVRINRLKAIPNHNRGIFSGLKQFLTRSGLFIVGLTRGPDGQRIHPRAWHLFCGSRDTKEIPRGDGVDSENTMVSNRKTIDYLSSSDAHSVSDFRRENLRRFSDVCRKSIFRGILTEEERDEASRRLKTLRERALETVVTSVKSQAAEEEEARQLSREGTPLGGMVSNAFRLPGTDDVLLLPGLMPKYVPCEKEVESITPNSHFLLSETNTDERLWSSDLEVLNRTHTLRPSSHSVYGFPFKNARDSTTTVSLLDQTVFTRESEDLQPPSNRSHRVSLVDPIPEGGDSGGDSSPDPSGLFVSTGEAPRKAFCKTPKRPLSPLSLSKETNRGPLGTPTDGPVTLPNLVSSPGRKVATPDKADRDRDHLSRKLELSYNEAVLPIPGNTDVATLSGNQLNITEAGIQTASRRRRRSRKQKSVKPHMISDYEKLYNESQVNMFSTNLPQAMEHIQMRKAATRILDDLDFDGESFLGLAKFSDYVVCDSESDGSRGYNKNMLDNLTSPRSWDTQGQKEVQELEVNVDQLQDRIDTEVEEDLADLIAKRNQLKAEVEEQQQLIDAFQVDLQNLSNERWGTEGDAFAIQLTAEVNQYAMEHRQQLQGLFQELSNDDDICISGITDSMLSQFVRGKADMISVGTQVMDSDLGFVDDELRETIEQMDEMFYHEKALRSAIDLTHVALSKVISFHASLELESTCKECFYLFEQPRTLWPCGHTFCQLCLSEMYNKSGELVCSECGSVCILGYTPNLSIELIASYQVLQDAKNKSSSDGKTIENTLQGLLNYLLSSRESFATAPGALTR
ncbi:unnamed protein product [Phytomonas sp. Hart1]|nr:unnamed protein product [Phytomonas sp. Hart1]|eukprot:CCW68254.1 unnamed protein product [Phytomonas sp. isolate Hart1]